jgi:cellulose synthase (UDP-forming)
MKPTSWISLLTGFFLLLLIFVFFHDIVLILIGTDGQIPSRILSGLLVGILFFAGIHAVSYADHLMRSLFAYSEPAINPAPVSRREFRVAVLIPVYNEEPDTVESCIRACKEIEYPNVDIYVLDDSTNGEMQAANRNICAGYAVHYIHRGHREGFKAGAINHAIAGLDDDTEYTLVIDSDQQVRPAIFRDLIPILEADESLSFIQTPQFFRSEPEDPVSVTFSYQQHIYNKHVCRGLSVNGVGMLTGSNSIFRVSHLAAIGGMDEECIAEDIATSFLFHLKGYRGIFLDTVYAEGLAPPTLAAYFTQQLRWAYGNIQLLVTILKTFLKQPRSMKPLQWLEFTVTVSSYLLGAMNLALFFLPAITLLLGIQILAVQIPFIFIVALVAVLALQFGISTRERQYTLRDFSRTQTIFNSLAFVYARAAWYVVSGKKLPFMVTPKKARQPASGTSSYVGIMPYLLVIIVMLLSVYAGSQKYFSGGTGTGTTIPIFWASYTMIVLASFLLLWDKDRRKFYEIRSGTTVELEEEVGDRLEVRLSSPDEAGIERFE